MNTRVKAHEIMRIEGTRIMYNASYRNLFVEQYRTMDGAKLMRIILIISDGLEYDHKSYPPTHFQKGAGKLKWKLDSDARVEALDRLAMLYPA